MKIYFPGWYLPGFRLWKGQLLDVWLLTVHVQIPPWDIRFWDGRWVWHGFTLFDTDWITDPVSDWISDVRHAIRIWIYNAWAGINATIDSAKALLYSSVHNAWSGITDFIDDVWASTYREIHRFWDAVIEGQANLTNVLYEELHELWDATVESVDRARITIIDEIRSLPTVATDAIIDFINKAFIGVAEMLIRSLDEMARDYYERHKEE